MESRLEVEVCDNVHILDEKQNSKSSVKIPRDNGDKKSFLSHIFTFIVIAPFSYYPFVVSSQIRWNVVGSMETKATTDEGKTLIPQFLNIPNQLHF